jgi:hypothetical protein
MQMDLGSAGVLARNLRRPAEGLSAVELVHNSEWFSGRRQSAGRRLEATGTVALPCFQLHWIPLRSASILSPNSFLSTRRIFANFIGPKKGQNERVR